MAKQHYEMKTDRPQNMNEQQMLQLSSIHFAPYIQLATALIGKARHAGGKTPLQIKNWWWEPDIKITEEMISAISDAFERFSRFLGVEMMEEKYWKEKLGILLL